MTLRYNHYSSSINRSVATASAGIPSRVADKTLVQQGYEGLKTVGGWATSGAEMLTGKTGGAAWLTLGLQGLTEMYQNRAIMAEAKNSANQLRRQGARAVEQGKRQAEDVREQEEFQQAEEARQLRNTGFLTGSESFGRGTGVGSVFEANKKAAEQLSREIISEADKQNQEYRRVAAETERAAKERTKGNIFGRIAKNIPVLKDL